MKVPPVFEGPASLVPLLLLLCIAPTVEAAPWNVGYRTIAAQDALTSETFPVALWYPTREATTALFVTGSLSPCRFPAIFCRWIAYEMPVARNAPAAAGVFGLIVVSHGAGGMALLHRDLGMALASQGYVVAAPTHARGTGNDISGVGVWVGRPKQVSGVIDVILDSTELGSHVDRGRIGVVGHSNGGFTALAVAGGKPSTSAVTAHCRQHPDDARFCAFGGAATRAATVEVRDIPELRDPRVRAIVLMAPNAAPFTDDALAHVTVPALVYAAENDDLTRVPYHAERLARALPQAECVLVKGAGHFSFVASFPAALKIVAGEAARDQPGFDRDALHELVNREIVGFFNRTLGPAGVSLTKAVQPPSCRPRESSDDTSPVPTLNGSRPRTSRSRGPWLALLAPARRIPLGPSPAADSEPAGVTPRGARSVRNRQLRPAFRHCRKADDALRRRSRIIRALRSSRGTSLQAPEENTRGVAERARRMGGQGMGRAGRMLRVFGCGIVVLSAAAIATAFFAVAAEAQCALPPDAKKLSACKGSARDVVIGPSGGAQCTKVFVNESFTGQEGFGTITIEPGGTLIVPDTTVSLEVQKIDVRGVLQAGTASCPIGRADATNQVTITFTGSRPCGAGNCGGDNKGLFVQAGGQLSLFGRKGTATPEQSWTFLKAPSPVNDSSLDLAHDVASGPGAWQKGDWIVVATTSFDPFESEFVRIQKPSVDRDGDTITGTKITLDQHKLKHAHFGGPDPGAPGPANFNAGADKNYGVDERAEVGLISRSIKLTAQISGDAPSRHWGGEIKIVRGFGKVEIQGVEIEKFGKDQIGSYPIHLHEIGPVAAGKVLINANSIHHSYNKCITIHSTQNLAITNNVCARIVGHIFYQEVGDEFGIVYMRNLGLGAMSNDFEIYAPTEEKREGLIKQYFWAGDRLGQDDEYQYHGLMIPNMDKQDNPTHGSCFKPDPAGAPNNPANPFTSNLVFAQPITTSLRKCPPNEYYVEPPSGFWIINPTTVLVNNSIGGCQGVGRAYWYVPPGLVIDTQTYNAEKRRELENLKHRLVGEFRNNRGHACYAGLYAETEFGVESEILNPRAGGVPSGQPVIAFFDQFTATRNRKRGVWLRPNWYVLRHARLATNVENVSLVTAGGLDGVAPGVWSLVEHSVIVGVSANNTDRFGPCPYPNVPFNDKPPQLGVKAGGKLGCVDQTPIPPGQHFHGGDIFESGGGYPDPELFLIGYMIYDGPVRMFDNRFVNFKVDPNPGLTGPDRTFLSEYSKKFRPRGENFVYEGDAALGWFTSNQSMYPVNTVGKGFTFTNVDLRHQIYTAEVNHAAFRDGDQNTAIIDLDGTLSGYVAIDGNGKQATNISAISLNNLPFNHAFNSVDECLAEGGQNKKFEGRPTALMSPGSVASLGFEAMFPDESPRERHDQTLVFRKDSKDFVGTSFEEHSAMELKGRDGRGIWEPKVTSGYGYTVSAGAGIPKVVMVTPGDVVMPDIGPDNTFHVRVGICYTSKDQSRNAGHPESADQFTVRRGYRSYGGGGIPTTIDKTLNLFWNRLENRFNGESCFDLNSVNPQNLDPAKGCPAHGITSVPPTGCPTGTTPGTDVAGLPVCVYPTSTLTKADCIDARQCANSLTKANGDPEIGKYFYDAAAGMLFFYAAQEFRNAVGPSPLGSCNPDGTGDPSCPQFHNDEKETYYPCPAQGCITYVVTLADSTYLPAPSTCAPYANDKYTQPAPAPKYRLGYREATNDVHAAVVRKSAGGLDNKFPHYTPVTAPICKP